MTNDQPTGASLGPGNSPIETDEIEDLREKISQLTAKIEADGLGWENDYKQMLLREVEQRIALRVAVLVGAAFVVVAMLSFAWSAFSYLTDDSGKPIVGNGVKVGLFVTPVLSATTIVIMMVIGAFKRAKDEDDDKVNLPSLFVEAFKASASK